MAEAVKHLVDALKRWGLTLFLALLLVIGVLLLGGNEIAENHPSLFVSLVVYCAYAGLLGHARIEITVFTNTKAHCNPEKDASGIDIWPFSIILSFHVIGFLAFLVFNICSSP